MLTSEIETTGRYYLQKIISRYLILSGWALLQCATRSRPHREMGKPLSSKTIRRGPMTLLTGRIRWVSGSLKMVSQARSRRRIGIRYRGYFQQEHDESSTSSQLGRPSPRPWRLVTVSTVALIAAALICVYFYFGFGRETLLPSEDVAEDRVIGASAATRGRSKHGAGGDAAGCAGQAGGGSVRAAETTIFGE